MTIEELDKIKVICEKLWEYKAGVLVSEDEQNELMTFVESLIKKYNWKIFYAITDDVDECGCFNYVFYIETECGDAYVNEVSSDCEQSDDEKHYVDDFCLCELKESLDWFYFLDQLSRIFKKYNEYGN